ncbi:hypothetical protein WS61_08720 [Burkholderia sp. ABCPW 11]|nr:hypothetical protein WS61_08720 [Burkholderia sp. ABCPW 11]
MWKASQLPSSGTRGVDTGHPALTVKLPGGGWPAGALVEPLAQQAGIGVATMALLPVCHGTLADSHQVRRYCTRTSAVCRR